MTIFEVRQEGEIRPVLVDNWTLERLVVMVVLKNNPRHICHLWVEIHQNKQEIERQPATAENVAILDEQEGQEREWGKKILNFN